MDHCHLETQTAALFSCGGESIEGSRSYRGLGLLICETHGASA